MSTSNLNKIDARMQQKHDIAENWKNSDFIPEAGEYIIYDPDEHTQFPRMKIGDGKTKVPNLPFVSEIYVQPDEPTDAEDGAIWINPDDQATGNDAAADWDVEEGEIGHIDNRPFWYEPIEIQWDGESYDSIISSSDSGDLYQLKEWESLFIRGEELMGAKLSVVKNSQVYDMEIIDYCRSYYEITKYLELKDAGAFVIDGTVLGYPVGTIGIVANIIHELITCYIYFPQGTLLEGQLVSGLFAISSNSDGSVAFPSNFKYNAIHIKQQYAAFFNTMRTPIHVLTIAGEDDVNIDFYKFQPGDIILIAGGT